MSRLVLPASPAVILMCPPVAAEIGFSARSGRGHDQLQALLNDFTDCPVHPSVRLVLEIQNALFTGGLLRAAGANDTVIAAYAIVNDATVLHYDRDFEHLAHAWPGFEQEWIAPRGSLEK